MAIRSNMPPRAAAFFAIVAALAAAVLLFTIAQAQDTAGHWMGGHGMGNGMHHGCVMDTPSPSPMRGHRPMSHGHGRGMMHCGSATNDAAANSPNTAEPAQTSAAEDNESPVSPGDSRRGQQLTVASGCLACHSLHATEAMVGPTWYNLAETAELRVPGQSAESYLHTSIVSPNAYIVEGYSPNVMVQTYARSLSEGELADIVSYLLTLEE